MEIITGGPTAFPNVPLDTYGKRASKVTTECSIWLRNVVKITDPNKPFYSHRHTATSYLRNTRLPDGSPAVKEDIERYILGHAGKGAHAGYGKPWFETLKAAVEVIPNPLEGSVRGGQSANRSYSPQLVSSSLWSRRSARSTANTELDPETETVG